MAIVVSPRYKLPAGYSNARILTQYVPWNGAAYPSPARAVRGASQQLAVASVPADLSTLIITAPNGATYTFQFVYNASVQNAPGSIKVPLPASGGSTAAQVTTALTAVLQLIPAFTLEGAPIFFPWVALSGDATHVTLNFTLHGPTSAIGGTQLTISVSGTAQQTFVLDRVSPAQFGQNFAFMANA